MKAPCIIDSWDMCRKALERTDACVLRLMFAMVPWERPMSYTEGQTEAEARRRDEVLMNFFARARALIAKFPHVSRCPVVTSPVRRA